MRAWHFSENAYPYLPPADSYPSIRVSLPNRIYDPVKGAALYDRYIDEWLIAEDEGVEIMLNEHHQTGDLRRSRCSANARSARSPEQEGPLVNSRQSDRQPPAAGSRRRRDGDDRCAFARSPGGRVRTGHAV
jgi:hypothetical protein